MILFLKYVLNEIQGRIEFNTKRMLLNHIFTMNFQIYFFVQVTLNIFEWDRAIFHRMNHVISDKAVAVG